MGVSHIALANHDRAHGHVEEIEVEQSPILVLDPPNARVLKAMIQVLDEDVVFRDDGGTPTPTHGIIIPAGDIWVFEADIEVMRVVVMRTVAPVGTARVRTAYYGY